MTKNAPEMNAVLKDVAELASARYDIARSDIDKVKQALELNRNGRLSIAEIQTDKQRWQNRLAREGTSALERVNGTADFQEIETISKLVKLSQSVCKIIIRDRYNSLGSGTGFLISPNLIITNNHVLPDSETASYSSAQFNYELDALGNPKPTSTFRLEPDRFFMTSNYRVLDGDAFSGLDFSIVAISGTSIEGISISEIPYCQLDAKVGKIVDGEGCVVIQHPQGEFKKIVLKDIRSLICTENHLIYESDTLPGSSGSMVVGLGTGEVVALHHSGVPKKNRHGQWLRKDGSVAQDGDPDDMIDWIGNEGVRISRILWAVKGMQIPASMDALRDTFLQAHPMERQTTESPVRKDLPVSTRQVGGHQSQLEDDQIWSFEVELSDVEQMQEDWKENALAIWKDIVSIEPLYPLSTDKRHRIFYYIKVRSNEDPWELAGKLEALPQIASCTPDLPMLSDIRAGHYLTWQNSDPGLESSNDGTASWALSEAGFKTNWIYAPLVEDYIRTQDTAAYRAWNRAAVNFDESLFEGLDTLDKVDVVQLDTGYGHHAKVKGNYDLRHDEDFIDGDDAIDEFAKGILRHPGHGMRTASIIIGRAPNDRLISNDGNYGLLYCSARKKPLINLIPYRIAKSVVLINRGKNLFDGVLHAINSGADIIYLCMGSYPRPMLYSIARTAYERGVIWVCAAGNEVESVVAPAVYPGTIAVAASNPDNKPWHGSSYGSPVDVAAPGEDVYVPFYNKRGRENMVFGSGTSYATPHVAAAAALWKAKYYDDLKDISEPWRIVERFRNCLKISCQRKNSDGQSTWDERFGCGILDMKQLLDETVYQEACALAAAGKEINAYGNEKDAPHWDLGVRELVHFLWGAVRKKMTPGLENFESDQVLSARARISFNALSTVHGHQLLESMGNSPDAEQARQLIRTYFESFS